MADFKLDTTTGDLVVDGGIQLVTEYDQEARQRLEQALAINLGEWFVDINAGLPYIENPKETFAENVRWFLGDKFPDTPTYISATMTDYLEELSFIKSVTATFTFDDRTRIFTYTPTCVLDDGQEITFPSIFTTNL